MWAALRPRQWTKNLLVFAGLVFGGRFLDAPSALRAAGAFVLFCALSSAVYLANDVVDAEEDRRHPRKRLRPVAAGLVSPRAALALAAVLGAMGLGGSAALGLPFLGTAAAYVALQTAYIAWARGVAVLDVVAVALGFVLRAVAGAVAVGVPYSPWLIVTTFLAAAMIALGKRRAEAASAAPAGARPALAGVPVAALDAALAATAGALLISYALYTILSPTAVGVGPHDPAPHLVWTFPPVVFGVLRYLLLVTGRGAGEEPEAILAEDGPTRWAVAIWILIVVGLLYGR